MSIKDITDYVRLTPGNTNPSVIGSMVQSEVNGTLKESKAYTDQEVGNLKKSGGAGGVETKTLKWYDTMETPVQQTYDERGRMVKVSDDVIDLASLKSLSFVSGLAGSGEYPWDETFPGSAFTAVACFSGGTNFVAGNMVWIWCISADEAPEGFESMVGTWFCNTDNEEEGVSIGIIAELETIHPIDSKFIPGAVLPVVELSTEPTVNGASLTEAESAMMDEADATGMPVIVRMVFPIGYEQTVEFANVFTKLKIGGSPMFASNILGINARITNDGDGWTITKDEE